MGSEVGRTRTGYEMANEFTIDDDKISWVAGCILEEFSILTVVGKAAVQVLQVRDWANIDKVQTQCNDGIPTYPSQ